LCCGARRYNRGHNPKPEAAAMPDIHCNCPSDCGWYEYSEKFEGSREDGDDY
jgi:hypothetical protein